MSTPELQTDSVSSLWFKHHTTQDSTIMQDATAMQIAMRILLRDRYWLTNCQPLGPIAIRNIRVRMERRNPRDVISQEEVDELLTPEFGFHPEVSADGELIGWHLPALAAQRDAMLGARAAERAKKQTYRAKQQGQQSAPEPHAPAFTDHGSNSIDF